MTNILFFTDTLATQLPESGGKGANLARLTQANFPVPPGFILRAQAFREFISAALNLFSRLSQLPTDDPAALASQAANIRADLAKLSLSPSLESEVRTALSDFSSTQSFSVRSSSTLEDLAVAAFAGQHETFLNCIGEARILEAIKNCYLSLFSDRAIAYRAQHRFPHEQAAMAVVVQQMVPCDSAGVAFTINPITGDLSELLINSNFGLGESVVSGEGHIDQFAIDKRTRALRDQRLGQKSHKIVPVAQGESSSPADVPAHTSGVTQMPLTPDQSSAPSLTPDQLTQLTDLALRVDVHYAFPQDIEWGFANNQLFLLQSRPITTIPPRWTRDESAERFPTAITPLTWDFVEDGFHRSLSYSLRLMGFPPFQGKWFSMFDHYIFGNQNAVDLYLKRIPLRLESLADIEAAIPQVRENYRWVQELPLLWSRDLDRYLIRIGEFMARPLEPEAIPTLWNYVKEVRELGADYFQPNIAISITQSLLHRVLYHLLVLTVGPTDAPRLHDSLLAFCETKTGMINAELYSLAEEVLRTPALLQLFRDHPSREIVEQKLLPPFRDFSARFDAFLRLHGHREVEFDAYHPTWLEIPWVVLDHIRLLLGALDPTFVAPAPRSATSAAEDRSLEQSIKLANLDSLKDIEGARLLSPDEVESGLEAIHRVQAELAHLSRGTVATPGDLSGSTRDTPPPVVDPVPHGESSSPAALSGVVAGLPTGSSHTPSSPKVSSRGPLAPEGSAVSAHGISARAVSPTDRERELRLRMHKAEIELFQRLTPSLHFFFHELIRLARAYTSLDDLEHYQTTRLTLPLRRGLRELGRRLYIRGVIADPMDIFFARAAALEKAVQSNDDKVWRALGESIHAEKRSYESDRHRTPAWSLDASPVARGELALRVEGSSSPAALSSASDVAAGLQTRALLTRNQSNPSGSSSTSHESPVASHVFSGLPGSPGQAQGPVFLIRSIDDFACFPKGSVLVARTTNPTWTPLFYNAVAVITESGGPLSHGAVTAREMQIPAVMSVRDCMSVLENGDTVKVDGSRGLVTLVK
jgi:phosphohistidine swiveling domain-containing protein